MDLIIYHNACPDGWCAAFICKKKYPEAELLPLNHGLSTEQLEPVFAAAKDKNVIMVDYSLRTRELNDRLNAAAKSFRILDHHKTAKATLEGASYATFDMKRSGAGLAWDYLFGKDDGTRNDAINQSLPITRPWWVNYTEDMDLWNWALPNSQEINAYLMVQPRDMKTWEKITRAMTAEDARRNGVGVRQYIEYYTKSVVAEVQEGVFRFQTGELESEDGIIKVPLFQDYRVGAINIPYAGVSEAGAALVEKGYEIGLAWFERGDGQTQFSIRTQKGGHVDASKIAKSFGGGGHQSAAGFELSIQEGRDLVDKILGRPNYLLKLAAEQALACAVIEGKHANEVIRQHIDILNGADVGPRHG